MTKVGQVVDAGNSFAMETRPVMPKDKEKEAILYLTDGSSVPYRIVHTSPSTLHQ